MKKLKTILKLKQKYTYILFITFIIYALIITNISITSTYKESDTTFEGNVLSIKNYDTKTTIIIKEKNKKEKILVNYYEKIDKINKLGYDNLPICMSKTQFSFSDNPKNLECTEPFSITIKDINLKAGAGFIVALTGNVITMPGLPKVPSAEKIDIDKNGQIIGLF